MPGVLPYSNISTHELVFSNSEMVYPSYHIQRPSLIPGIPDEYMSVISPFVAYWIVSGIFSIIDALELPFFEKYRIHESEEVKSRNTVTRWGVVKAVLLQQVFQTMLGLWYIDEEALARNHAAEMSTYSKWISRIVFALLGEGTAKSVWTSQGENLTWWTYWWGVPVAQYLWAFFVLDTWQYFLHRYFHTNKFLYRHIHSWHHRLYVPYSYGALYNHPLEGFLFDSLGGVVAHQLSFMSVRQAVVLFGICTAKTVDDHCGYALPFDPFQLMCGNNADYHDIHHQTFGIKKNFAQPWFTHWDAILGTRMRRSECPDRKKVKKEDSPLTRYYFKCN
ncbi:hypothetical protein BT69DRAFT_1307089 [Atractiella rhizophila]|nr:hypothetical protein BT69DRAFT_1307089 [Atractiella rhizophila]